MQLKEIRNRISSLSIHGFGFDEEARQTMLSRIDELSELVGDDFFVQADMSRFQDSLYDNLDRMYDILGGGDDPQDSESDYQQFLLKAVMVIVSKLKS